MEGRRENPLRRAAENKKKQEALLEKGWKSTGDIPFILARKLNKPASVLTSKIVTILKGVLELQTLEYEKENVQKIGSKTMISSDLMEKIENEVRNL